MVLAGIAVGDTLVLELAIMLRRGNFPGTADLLEGCVAAGLSTAALTDADREAIVSVLVDPADGLDELRTALVHEDNACRAQSV